MSSIKRQIQKSKVERVAKSITKSFLEGIYFSLDVLSSMSAGRFSIYSSLRTGPFSEWSDTKISRKLQDVERGGYIKINHNSDSIEFTDKAVLKIVESIVQKTVNDRRNRFISFDIPEEKRRERNGFRRTIKRIGFRQIQKSLWVCNKDVGGLVEAAKREYGVDKYVIYIVSEKSDIDDHIEVILNNDLEKKAEK